MSAVSDVKKRHTQAMLFRLRPCSPPALHMQCWTSSRPLSATRSPRCCRLRGGGRSTGCKVTPLRRSLRSPVAAGQAAESGHRCLPSHTDIDTYWSSTRAGRREKSDRHQRTTGRRRFKSCSKNSSAYSQTPGSKGSRPKNKYPATNSAVRSCLHT